MRIEEARTRLEKKGYKITKVMNSLYIAEKGQRRETAKSVTGLFRKILTAVCVILCLISYTAEAQTRTTSRTITTSISDTCHVYTGARGGRYIWKIHKTGKHAGEKYKYYLPKEKETL